MIELTAIMTAHREGAKAAVSLRSLMTAAQQARATGLDIECLVLLDDADEATRSIFDVTEHRSDLAVHEVAFGDQGLTRNHAVALSSGRYLAFLDGDDLWSENWLTAAHEMCESDPGTIIAHPEVDWFFGANNNLFFHADQTEQWFDPSFLRVANYWDALCVAPREAHVKFPYSARAVDAGYAYEDWLWNIETLDAGFVHRSVPGTIHFKRRRRGSQNIVASVNQCLTRPHPFFRYESEARTSWPSPDAGEEAG